MVSGFVGGGDVLANVDITDTVTTDDLVGRLAGGDRTWFESAGQRRSWCGHRHRWTAAFGAGTCSIRLRLRINNSTVGTIMRALNGFFRLCCSRFWGFSLCALFGLVVLTLLLILVLPSHSR